MVDPYLEWLNIPPAEQPPDHYRLLGLERFENDRMKIKAGADQSVRRVKMYQRGPHEKTCEELLYRINVARSCLMNPSLKNQYDQGLRRTLGVPEPREPERREDPPSGSDTDKGMAPESPTQITQAAGGLPAGDDDLSSLLSGVLEMDTRATSASSGRNGDRSGDRSGGKVYAAADLEPLAELDLVLDDDLSKLLGESDTPGGDDAAESDLSMDLPSLDIEPEVPVPQPAADEGEKAAGEGKKKVWSTGSSPSAPKPAEKGASATPTPARQAAAASGETAKAQDSRPTQTKAVNRGAAAAASNASQPRAAGPQSVGPQSVGPQSTGYIVLPSDRSALLAPANPGYEVIGAAEDGAATGTPADSPDLRAQPRSGGMKKGQSAVAATPATAKAQAGAVAAATKKTAGVKKAAQAASDNAAASDKAAASKKGGRRSMLMIGAMAGLGVLVIGLYAFSAMMKGPDFSKPLPRASVAPPQNDPPSKAPPEPSSQPFADAFSELIPPVVTPPADEKTTVGIAYGTEKRSWLQWALKEFGKTDPGRKIKIDLIPMGSLEGANAILNGDERINVWSPASRLYQGTFEHAWASERRGQPFVRDEVLAVTPMVFVMWRQRYEAFLEKSSEVSFTTITNALQGSTGWAGIANKPEWGHFKFSHTYPTQSNSGLMTLVLFAYECYGRGRELSPSDIHERRFQRQLADFERGVSGLSNSTGNLMREMLVKGPSSCDALMVYESVAIESLRTAEVKWDELRIVYPKYNLWSDHPYFILNTPWTSQKQKEAAGAFLRFLLSEPVQAKALDFGFRPGNTSVPIHGDDSPFTRYKANGLKYEVSSICDVPSESVIEALLQSWKRHAVPE